MSAQRRPGDATPLGRLGRRLAAVSRGRVLAGSAAVGSVLGVAVGTLAGRRAETGTPRAGQPTGPSGGARHALAPGRAHAAAEVAAEPVTAERILTAWQDSATGRATTFSHLPAEISGDTPVRLMGSLPGYSFWIGTEADSPLVLRVQAVWDRTLPASMLDTLRRAVNDWNRDHVWPTVWTLPTHTGHTVGASATTDLAHGASNDQLVVFLDVALAGIDGFFSALDTATTPPDGEASGRDLDVVDPEDTP